MKKPIGIFVIILLLISLIPSRVFADSTYVITDEYNTYQVGGITIKGIDIGSYINPLNFEYIYVSMEERTGKRELRWTTFLNSNNNLVYTGVWVGSSDTYPLRNLNVYIKNDNRTNYYTASRDYTTINGVRYNVITFSLVGATGQDTTTTLSNTLSKSSDYSIANAVYYTYGDGAVAPEDPISFGDLKNLGFYTKFVNSQQSNISQMALNKDVITWDPFQDTNGNDLNNADYRVDIQAATIDYEASTKSDLLNQVLNDMTTGSWSELVSITPNVGQYEITWDQVAQQLWHTDNITIEFWNNLFNVYDSARGVFFKNGWIYRVRLRTSDNSYVGQWQTVYNITSMPPADSDKVYTNYYVYNYTVPNEDTYQIIQNINNINNTENNWYQNDQPFNPETAGDNWLSKLIEAILSFLGQLIHDILGLFTFESFEIPDFESNKINIINNTGMFGESLQFTDQLKQAIENVEYVEPVLTYPGLTIDNVQLIQPMTFNLNDYVQNEEIQDIRSLAYLVTDGFIYLCLVLLIKNKIMGVLKK